MGYPASCQLCVEQGVEQEYLSAPIELKCRPFTPTDTPEILIVGQDPTIRSGEAATVLMLDLPRNPVYNFIKGKILNPLDLTLDDIAATNVVKCTFPGNRPPNSIARENRVQLRDESRAQGIRVETAFLRPFFDTCKQYLVDEIRELRPKVLLSLGEPCHQLLVTSLWWPIGLRLKEVFGCTFPVETPFTVGYVPCAHQNFPHEFYRAKWHEFLETLEAAVSGH